MRRAASITENRRVAEIAIVAAVALSLANAVAQAIDFGFFDLRYQAFNSNTHASIFGVVSLAACGLAVVGAFLASRGTGRITDIVLPLVLLGVLAFRAWSPPHVLVLAFPLTVVALVILWREEGSSRALIRAGCVLLVASFAIHALESHSLGGTLDPDSWTYQIRCLVKHDTELAGWILIAFGLFSVARERKHPSERDSHVRQPLTTQ